jgi:hypothetical protein
MSDEKDKGTPPVVPPAPKGRKYTYLGKAYANPKVKLTIGSITLRPWAMTDEEIDKLLTKQPQLARLWKTG